MDKSKLVGPNSFHMKEFVSNENSNGQFSGTREISFGAPAAHLAHAKEEDDTVNGGVVAPSVQDGRGYSEFNQWEARGNTFTLLQNNILSMPKTVGVMLFVLVLPVIQSILFYIGISQDPTSLRIAIVNLEMDWNTKDCPVFFDCTFQSFSCRYINSLPNDTLVKEYYETIDEALGAVKMGNAWGAIYFSDNFTEARVASMALKLDTDNETLDQSTMKVWLDMSNQQIGSMVKRELEGAFNDFNHRLFESCSVNSRLADLPIEYNKPVYGSEKSSFFDFLIPGMILTFVFFLAVPLTTSTLIVSRTDRLLGKSWVAGTSSVEILFSHLMTQSLVMFIQTALILILMFLVFRVECQGNIFNVILLSLLQGLSGISFGFVISAICDLEMSAVKVALGSFYPTLLLSGVMWPVEGMPVTLRHISTYLPLTMAIKSLRIILTRGWPIDEPDVYWGFISTLISIALFLFISLIVLTFKLIKTRSQL